MTVLINLSMIANELIDNFEMELSPCFHPESVQNSSPLVIGSQALSLQLVPPWYSFTLNDGAIINVEANFLSVLAALYNV